MVALVTASSRQPEGMPLILNVPDGELCVEVPQGWYRHATSPLPIHWYANLPNSKLEIYLIMMPKSPGITVKGFIEYQLAKAIEFGTRIVSTDQKDERTHTSNRHVSRTVATLTEVPSEVAGNQDGIPYLCWGFSGIEGTNAIYILQSCEFSDKPLTSDGHHELTRIWHESFTLK